MSSRTALLWIGCFLVAGGRPLAAQDSTIWHVEIPQPLRSGYGTFGEAQFSPDNRWVATADGGPALVWEVATGRLVRRFHSYVDWVSFSPDGQWLLTTGIDTTARVWDMATGREVSVLRGHRGYLNSARFSPDGHQVVTGSADGTARLWELPGGRELLSFQGHNRSVTSVAFSLDGRSVVTGSEDSTVRVWDVADGRELHQLRGTSPVHSVTALANGPWIAIADNNSTLWNPLTGESREGPVRGWGTRSAPDGNWIAASGNWGIRVWRFPSGDSMMIDLPILEGSIVALSKDLTRLLALHDSTASVWRVPEPDSIRSWSEIWTATHDTVYHAWPFATPVKLDTLVSPVVNLPIYSAFSADGRWIVTTTGEVFSHQPGRAEVWDRQTGRLISSFWTSSDVGPPVAFAPDGRRLAVIGNDDAVRIWDWTSRTITDSAWRGRSRTVQFSPDGSLLITADLDSTARIWKIDSDAPPQVLRGHQGPVIMGVFSSDGRRALTTSSDSTARLWDLETGRQLLVLRGHNSWVHAAGFSPDGRLAVTTGGDRAARVWDLGSGIEIQKFRADENIVQATFSPDGQTVLTAGYEGIAQVWDLATGSERIRLGSPTDWVTGAVFSPDGRLVLTTGNMTVRLWDSRTGELVATRVSLPPDEWAAFAPNGHFTGSVEGWRALHVTNGQAAVPLDQFFNRFHDPRVLVTEPGGARATGSDIRRGFPSPPAVRFLSPPPPKGIDGGDPFVVAIEARDQGGGVAEVRLFFRGKLIGRAAPGRGIRDPLCPRGATCFRYDPRNNGAWGGDSLEATALSLQGIESFPAFQLVDCCHARSADSYTLAIGIDQDSGSALRFATGYQDARHFADTMRALLPDRPYGYRHPARTVRLLGNREASAGAIRGALRHIASKAHSWDMFVLFIAARAIVPPEDPDHFYLLPSDVKDPSDTNQVRRRGISQDELQDLIEPIAAGQKLIIIEACQCGPFGPDAWSQERLLTRFARATGAALVSVTETQPNPPGIDSTGTSLVTRTLLDVLNRRRSSPRGSDVASLLSEFYWRIPTLGGEYRRENVRVVVYPPKGPWSLF